MKKAIIGLLIFSLIILVYPTVAYFIPFPEKTLTTPDNATLIPEIPAIDKTHDLSTDLLLLLYPENRYAGYNESEVRSFMIDKRVLIPGDRLVSRGQMIGDIIHVQVTIKPEAKAEAETFFYSILGYSFGDQITIEGWLPLNKVKELEALEGVISIDLVWPPTRGSASIDSSRTSSPTVSSLKIQVTKPILNNSRLQQTPVNSLNNATLTNSVKSSQFQTNNIVIVTALQNSNYFLKSKANLMKAV